MKLSTFAAGVSVGLAIPAVSLLTASQNAPKTPALKPASRLALAVGQDASDDDNKTSVPTPAASPESNQRLPQAIRIERNYPPLRSDAARYKSVKVCEQTMTDLLSLFNQAKQLHWNVSGALYLPLHEEFQKQADYFRMQADTFAERSLQLGWSVDGRYSHIAQTSNIPDLRPGYWSDDQAIKALFDHQAVLEKEIYAYIDDTSKTDPVTSNKLQDLAYGIDKQLWQLRIHLQRPGGTGNGLPYVPGEGGTGLKNDQPPVQSSGTTVGKAGGGTEPVRDPGVRKTGGGNSGGN